MIEDGLRSPLPTVNGVGPSCQWLPVGPWKTILEFLEERFPRVEIATWLSRMDKGLVLDESGLPVNARSPYRAGGSIFYYRELESETTIPFVEHVLFRDENILVVDKPHFLPVVPSGRFLHETLLVRLKKRERLGDLVPVHRIDRETAGVALFSLNASTRGSYASLFQNRRIEKVYEALAGTRPELEFPMARRSRIVAGEPFYRMKEVEGRPNSETHIDVLNRATDASLYRLKPITGRKHQLRLHLSALGIPIVNDKLYPDVSSVEFDDFANPLKLLAKSISFKDPLSGQERYFESERSLLAETLGETGKWGRGNAETENRRWGEGETQDKETDRNEEQIPV
jgi:tRNA pseudouridine32 synthase/23S rRNA pseudouridine746 synthase